MTNAGDMGQVSDSPQRSEGKIASGVPTPEMRQGQWGPVLKFANAAIHAHVLPDGRVLMWGRRDNPTDSPDVHECTPFVWDPKDPTEPADPTTAKTVSTPQPTLADGTKVNLFCGGHTFLPDGRLLTVGGHLKDNNGVNQASIYDFAATSPSGSGTWQATARMLHGRWYPTATTLPDGSVLALAGSYFASDGKTTLHNETPQVWFDDTWANLRAFHADKRMLLDLYPRAHVISDGRVFISGPHQWSWLLNTANGGSWERTSACHPGGQLDYAPAVMYDVDKIIYIGGGGGDNQPPANDAETIDLQKTPLAWEPTSPMKFRRRQHNGTLLADGTVLVTGGTRGERFNNLDAGQPVHTAELWDPATGKWTELADEEVDRCYHSTAVLLPDATVLSAGGGEFYAVENVQENDPKDTHRNGQIFRPPYLFKGDRPEITSAPTRPIHYGDTFEVESPHVDTIAKVTWIRLSSVTHSFNTNQRINFLESSAHAGKLRITAPKSPNVCPPGHYMLFILNTDGVPSVARILQIRATQEPIDRLAAARPAIAIVIEPADEDVESRRAAVAHKATGPSVVVGLTSTCPYGLGACWGGAYEALNQLEGIDLVNPDADAEESTAEVFLAQEGLPPLNRWVEQFRAIVNGRYEWRGVEITFNGVVEERDGSLLLASSQDRPAIRLAPLTAAKKIQFDNTARALKPLHASEARAHEQLGAAVKNMPERRQVTVTGPLEETPSGYLLHVRQFSN